MTTTIIPEIRHVKPRASVKAGLNNGCKKPPNDYDLYVFTDGPETEAIYHAALELVARIDEDLSRGVHHYRTKAGVLLTTLDEVVHAILADNLMEPVENDNDSLLCELYPNPDQPDGSHLPLPRGNGLLSGGNGTATADDHAAGQPD